MHLCVHSFMRNIEIATVKIKAMLHEKHKINEGVFVNRLKAFNGHKWPTCMSDREEESDRSGQTLLGQ